MNLKSFREKYGFVISIAIILSILIIIIVTPSGPIVKTITTTKEPAQDNAAIKYRLSLGTAGTGSGKIISSPAGIDCGAVCSENYKKGTSVALTALPSDDSVFAGWGGDCGGNSNTCTLIIDSTKKVIAKFIARQSSMQQSQQQGEPPEYFLTVAKSGTGLGTIVSFDDRINCGPTCKASYKKGTSVSLKAAPSANSYFVGWGGACTGTSSICTFSVDSEKAANAKFVGITQLQSDLTVAKQGTGSGIVVSADNTINCGSVCSTLYNTGATVALKAIPDNGSTFAYWGNNCAGNSTICALTMAGSRAATAYFERGNVTQYLLTANKRHNGSGLVFSTDNQINCGQTCTAFYPPGAQVTLKVIPDSNSFLYSWYDACFGTSPSCTLTMDRQKTATVFLEPISRLTLNITKTGGGSGTVASSDGKIDCGADCSADYQRISSTILKATPSSGSIFGGWSGGHCNTVSPGTCNVVIDSPKRVVARFVLRSSMPLSISINHSPANPTVNQPVTFTAVATHNETINGIWIFIDYDVVQYCDLNENFGSCTYERAYTSPGPHTYFASTNDFSGNEIDDPPTGAKSFTVR